MSKKYDKSMAITKLFKRAKVLYKYILDRDVSIYKKLLVIAALVYVVSPLDLIPEVVLGLGIVDDVVLFVFLISMISEELDKYIGTGDLEEQKDKYGKVIEVDFTRVDEENQEQ